jgi:hypothetical protein
LLTTPYLSPLGISLILRNALLTQYYHVLGIDRNNSYIVKLELPSANNIEKNEFDSREEQLIAASNFYNNALLSFV